MGLSACGFCVSGCGGGDMGEVDLVGLSASVAGMAVMVMWARFNLEVLG